MISYWNRGKKRREFEQVYGEKLVDLLYLTTPGQLLTDLILARPLFSKIYGAYQNTGLSARKIKSFIHDFKIPMEEFEPGPYFSFNEFFVRRFRSEARHFVTEEFAMPAFAEGRYFAFDKIEQDTRVPLKGKYLQPEEILGSEEKAKPFIGGPVLVARLCPVDYHRFHFPDDGDILEEYSLGGNLHSVNPVALKYRGDILSTNERHVSILETENFGKLAYVEVGALCVGKIVQTFRNVRTFKRGEEKGYFLFGGSSIVLVGEPGAWKPDADLLEKTQAGLETLVQLGERIAFR